MPYPESLPHVVSLPFLVVAAVTDVRGHKIYNWTTYPGMVAGFLVNGVHASLEAGRFHPWPGLEASLKGFLACGLLMLVCAVFFQIGGGDVKLIAMMGAFLGLQDGMEAMLWTFVLGAVVAVVVLVWQIGFVRIVTKTWNHAMLVFKSRSWVPPTTEERGPLQQDLFLGPAGVVAVGLVMWRRFG